MIKSKGIFAVSFIAMMVVGGAYANIASQGYVDQQIDTRQVAGDYATNTALGSVRTTATNAQSAATAAKTAADEAADAADAAASAAATAQKTANAKVSTAQGSSAANKAVITNAAGNITTGTISSAMITDGTITNADIATNAAIAQSKISGLTTALAGKANTADVPTKTSDLTNDSGFITAEELPDGYTLPVATANTLGGVKSGGDITVATSGAVTVNSANQADTATTATSATKATQDASGNVITTTYATKSELTNGLSGKQATLSGAQLNAVNSGITSAKVSTYDGYNAKITAAQNAADSKVATAQGSSAANKAVITNASGNITTGTIASGMIANDAVTSAKIATGAVGADALAANAVTSAKIADGTITNADIATNAAIAASKVSGLATVATSGSYNDLSNKPTIPTVNNATLTIKKNGATVDTFTANASANKTINITVPTTTSGLTNDSGFITADDLPDDYNLPVATSSALGGVKSGGDITVSSTGVVTVKSATTADSATKATQDASGNNIVSTYATKAQLTALDSTSSGTGAVVTNVSQTNGKVSVTKGNVRIPVGSATATSYATIWVQ